MRVEVLMDFEQQEENSQINQTEKNKAVTYRLNGVDIYLGDIKVWYRLFP